MSDKVREKFEALMAEGDRSGYTRESLAWVCWLASRAAALEEAMHAVKHGPLCKGCKRVGRNAIRALAGRGA